ncbi:P-loop containing nucleoside triphosphate hydrolase protein, partial [Coemansia mojavensis]
VSLTDCCFSWNDYNLDIPSLHIRHGEFVTVVGKVGSGKSSLISAISGEMPLTSGTATAYGNISYVSQKPWIMNATFRDNVLFGNKYDQSKYTQVIHACALVDDIQEFPAGDMTEIGHSGINLSGGQKARLALARAIYNDGDIFLLDDVLSAVDAHVEQHLIKHVLKGILANKTRILVTHAEYVIPLSNRNIVMENGKLTISSNLEIKKYDSKPNSNDDDNISTPISLEAAAFKVTPNVLKSQPAYLLLYKYVVLCGFGVIAGGLAIELVGVCLSHYLNISQNQLISSNASSMNLDGITRYLILDLLLFVAESEFELLRDWFKSNIWNSVSLIKLRKQLLYKLTFAKLTYYERLSYSSITQAYNDNARMIAYGLALSASRIAFRSFKAISYLIIAFQVSPTLLLVTGIAAYPVAQLCKLENSIDLGSKIFYDHDNERHDYKAELIDGYQVIRIHQKVSIFMDILKGKMVNCIQLSSIGTYEFYKLVYQLFDMLVVAGTLICSWYLAVYKGHTLSPGMVDQWININQRAYKALELVLGGDKTISSRLAMFSKHLAFVDELEQEASQIIKDHRHPTNWPPQGIIEFKSYSMLYRADAGLVLKALSFTTRPSEKIGIVGRTGAGKSSLTFALLRLVEAAQGSIYIDGIDISTIGLHELRSSIAMVPQDPMLLPGTIRDNLDPGNEYNDATIQLALEKTGIWPLLDDQLDTWVDGTSFSAGQRQLLSLSRALLWNRKIVILDEATANIDSHTDQLIQQLIRQEFAHSTVLTIAHRLNTVMDSDRILVMDQGQVAEFDTPQALLQQPDSHFSKL